ncbi:MAG TPA: hypothetical protein VKA46_17225 [Gemmataceae bacterium]|nr:hypothetical protein [Gemmataceae bacterium]
MLTTELMATVFGADRGDMALVAMPLVPAAALVDGVTAATDVARRGVSWLRRRIGLAALAVAQRCGVVPVATAAVYPVASLPPVADVVIPFQGGEPYEPAVAAQAVEAPSAPATVEPIPAPAVADGLRAALETHGTVRAAARALGVAESTLRGRCRKAGVKLPGRRNRKAS